MKDQNDINPNVFWYVVGYIAADGSLSKDNRHVSITSKDHSHLENIKKELGITSRITKKSRGFGKEKIYSVLQMGGVSTYRFLNSIGMFSRKSWGMGELKINEEYFIDFLRGVIDGDGCIYSWKHKNNKHIQWSLRITGAAPKFIYWLKDSMEKRLSVKGKMHTQNYQTKSTIYIIKFDKLATQTIVTSTYYDNCFCLERKLMKARECLQDKAKMLKYGQVICSSGEIGKRNRLKICRSQDPVGSIPTSSTNKTPIAKLP